MGKVDRSGQFTGHDITFVYSDFLTGWRGEVEQGVLKDATAVDIVGERCNDGIKELLVETAANDGNVRWVKEEANHTYVGKHPLVMDPY